MIGWFGFRRQRALDIIPVLKRQNLSISIKSNNVNIGMSASGGQCKSMVSSHQRPTVDHFSVFTPWFPVLLDRFDKRGITDGFRLRHFLHRPPVTCQSVSYTIEVGRQLIPINACRTYRTLHIGHRTSRHIAMHHALHPENKTIDYKNYLRTIYETRPETIPETI